MIFKQ